jgi:ribonuclease BN (tRNA processing enzyme)
MRVKFYGTRGSIPIARPDAMTYGGNTTSLRVISECLPPEVALVVDTGSGFVPLSRDLVAQQLMRVWVIYTHWHHDHTQGLVLAPHTFVPSASLKVWGPKEHGIGPQEVFQTIMKPPYFPKDFSFVRHRFSCHNLENIGTQVLVFHPEGRSTLMPVHVFEKAVTEGKQLPFGRQRHPVEECLVVRMHKTAHPEYTVSYRFEERPTGRVFVLLTDHENTDGMPRELLWHLSGAHLLVQDCQYSRKRYDEQTTGFGHGTPDYCARTAVAAGVAKLGLTHHDPGASDQDVEHRVQETREAAEELAAEGIEIFACADYQEVEV